MATTNILNMRDDTLFGSNSLPVKVTGMQSMASKMWVPFLGMGFMIVVARVSRLRRGFAPRACP